MAASTSAVHAGDDHSDRATPLSGTQLLRRGETLGLAWEDVDLNAGEVRIRWQLQRAGGQLVRRPTKTVSSDAVLPLPQVCIDAAVTPGTGDQAAARGGAGMAQQWPGVHHPVRAASRPAELPPHVQGARRRRGRAGGVGALDASCVRLASRRARGTSARRHAGPPTQPHRGHHGHLLPGGRSRHSRRSKPAGVSPV